MEWNGRYPLKLKRRSKEKILEEKNQRKLTQFLFTNRTQLSVSKHQWQRQVHTIETFMTITTSSLSFLSIVTLFFYDFFLLILAE